MPDPTPWCSVVIPTLDEVGQLPATLSALHAAFPAAVPFEIIIVDGGSTDGTRLLPLPPNARLLSGPTGRARQLNYGAARARGRYLYFLHADTRPPVALYEQLLRAATRSLPASCRIRFHPASPAVRLFGWLSRFNVAAFRYGDQSLFVSRAAFLAAGGYRNDHLLMEDYELALRLRRRAGGFLVLPVAVISSARRYQRFGACYTQACYVLVYALYRLGWSQLRLRAVFQFCFSAGTKVGAARKLPSAAHSNQR